MIFDYATFKLIWLFLIGFLMIAFAITGGFDLGVGALLPFIGKNDKERRLIINSIGPTWEGNQVWFITAAAAIFAAWPFMYAAIFSSFYFALLIILLALILRPPGFDYRSKISSPGWRQFWDWSLCFSGFVPSVLFGVTFGNLFLGIPFEYDDTFHSYFKGSFLSLLSPFALLTGLLSLSLLLTHASFFLQLKTQHPIQDRAKQTAQIVGLLFLIIFCFTVYWTLYKLPGFQITFIPDINTSFSPLVKQVSMLEGGWIEKFQAYPLAWAAWLAPITVILGIILALVFSSYNFAAIAMVFSSLAITSVIVTAGMILFPFILPSSIQPNHSLTIWDAASSHLTLSWMFWAVVIFLPIVLAYTTWVFRVMRGKLSSETTLKSESY